MKQILISLLLISCAPSIWSQENMISLSAGYAFANIEDVETNATGWRINLLYEFNPNEGMLSHGLSFGYIGTKAESNLLSQTSEYKLNSWPIYYAPKIRFGNEKIKAFLKGALGMHSSIYKRSGTIGDLSTFDLGFYGGAAAGVIFQLNAQVFISAEYEWAYLSNSYYVDGFMNSVMGGIGIKF